MIRVLQVSSSLRQGGAESMIMNIYEKIDRTKVQFDFLVYDDDETPYTKRVEELGGRVIRLHRKNRWNLKNYERAFGKIIQKFGPYKAVHVHTNFHSGMVLYAAKKNNIPVRVCHSHTTKDRENINFGRKIYQKYMKCLILNNANVLLACSNEAGKALYGERDYRNRGIFFPNAIDIELYKDKAAQGDKVRNEFCVSSDEIFIGSVASFREAKNHEFMIEIALGLKKRGIPFKFAFVGGGTLFEKIKVQIKDVGLENEIILPGIREDIPELMNAFDVLLMPSLYEGFPVTLVESQAAGLPAVISSRITNEVNLELGLIDQLDLEDSLDKWINTICLKACHKNVQWEIRKNVLENKGFNVTKSIIRLYNIYGVSES